MSHSLLNTTQRVIASTVRNAFRLGVIGCVAFYGFAYATSAHAQSATPTVASSAASVVDAKTAAPAFEVKVSGRGPAMILIPGLTSHGEVWDATVKHFEQRYECHVLTLSGFAGTKPIDQPLVEATKKQLAQYIADKKLSKPVLVGHSMGGFLGMSMAIEYPQLLGKLVIVDSLPSLGAMQFPMATADQLKAMAEQTRQGMLNMKGEQGAAMQRRMIAGMVTAPADIERVLQWGAKSDTKTVADSMYTIMATDLRQDVAKVQVPTLVLGSWYAYKDFTTREAVENTFKTQYAKLPGVQVKMSEKGYHFLQLDDPTWVHASMDSFLK